MRDTPALLSSPRVERVWCLTCGTVTHDQHCHCTEVGSSEPNFVNYADELARHAAALSARAAWQPIETAPRSDGQPIVVWVRHNGPAIVSWNTDSYEMGVWDNWMEGSAYGLPMRYDLTHWMPLPAPPEKETEG